MIIVNLPAMLKDSANSLFTNDDDRIQLNFGIFFQSEIAWVRIFYAPLPASVIFNRPLRESKEP